MKIGDQFKNFDLKDNHDKIVNTSDFESNNALLLLFYAENCPYSKEYKDRIEQLVANYEEDDINILLIRTGHANGQSILEADKMKLEGIRENYVVNLKDPDKSLSKDYDVKVTPEAFLFNKYRELVYRGAVDDAWQNQQLVTRVYLEDALEYALDGLEIDYPEIEAEGTPITSIK
jgi:peroxiredoxin